jgi:hypothetical protein
VNSAQAILDEMVRRGVTARVDRETLRLKPRKALDDDLLASIKEHKPDIIRALAHTTAACGDDYLWPPESIAAEHRFGQPHAKWFPLIGRKVLTPTGPGTLLQVFADRVTVLLDSDLGKCAFFSPDQITRIAMRGDD